MDRLALNNKAIDQALNEFGNTNPATALRASISLSKLLAPVQQSIWPEVNYSFSKLTGDGFPFEFTFSSATNAISYTLEIAGPEIPEEAKIKKAVTLLKEYSIEPLNSNALAFSDRLAKQAHLRYGAWMGGRHTFTDDRYKIYLEITPECRYIGDNFLQAFIQDASVVSRDCYRLRMISISSNDKSEYYFRLFNIDVWQLQYLMRSMGFAEQGKELLDFITLISKRNIDQSFIGNNLGFSVALDKYGLPEAISVFTFNYKVFEPGDCHIRKKLLECSNRFGWDFDSYARITEPIAHKTGMLTNHGLVAFSITRDGMKIIQVGLRPPGHDQLTEF